MRLSTIVLAAVVAIGAIAFARGVSGAEQHPAMTSDTPPGWQLHRALPGQEFQPRGRYFDNRTGCLLDLASDRHAMPSGTRLACIKIERKDQR